MCAAAAAANMLLHFGPRVTLARHSRSTNCVLLLLLCARISYRKIGIEQRETDRLYTCVLLAGMQERGHTLRPVAPLSDLYH